MNIKIKNIGPIQMTVVGSFIAIMEKLDPAIAVKDYISTQSKLTVCRPMKWIAK